MESSEQLQPIARDRQNGMTYKAIAQKYQIDQRTAKRYADHNLPLADLYHRPFSSILDPYREEIDSWLASERIFSSVIYDWLCEEGFTGSYSLVNRYVQKKIRENEDAGIYPPDGSTKRYRPSESPLRKAGKEQKYAADLYK